MTHYAQHIQQYDSVNNIDIKYNKIIYKFLIKIFFSQINKCKSFQ